MRLSIPYKFDPRPYQLPLLQALDSGKRRAIAIWHRRAGKDKTLINLIVKKSLERVGVYFYLFPTYSQGKKILWDGIDGGGFKFRDHIPQEIVARENSTEMKIELINGSLIQIVGTDNVDTLVGTNPVGCVFSEYALQSPTAWSFLRPILTENGGWAVFNYTPRGKNHGFDLYQKNKNNPDWFVQILDVNATNAISGEDIQRERDAGMDEELIQQEFYCSFDGVVSGAYYGKQLRDAYADKRITSVPYNAAVLVDTFWDLGMGDATAIWFVQAVGKEIHIIDYYEASGEGLAHYVSLLRSKNYHYGDHYAPHDIDVRELGTGKSRKEVAASLGINFRITPKLGIDEGINAARMIFSQCWFDEKKCDLGIKALESYHKEYDEKRKIFSSHPKHDWSSHAADAFRYFAVGFKQPQKYQPIIYKDSRSYV